LDGTYSVSSKWAKSVFARWQGGGQVFVGNLMWRGGDDGELFWRKRGGMPSGQAFANARFLTSLPNSEKIRDSLGVYPENEELRCKHLRELLNREDKYGTQTAALMSSTAYGWDKLFGLNNHMGAMIVNYKPIDQDWLINLKSVVHDTSLQTAAVTYASWKAVWWGANQLPGGKEVGAPFKELGEKNAVALAGSLTPFSSIFDERFMEAVCKGY
ncbi:MAG TPA: hypothetical protein VN843_22805, partial [Anaerolineales bacterium]|nr:hypothetical protein [Anaerolineales bacterium]